MEVAIKILTSVFYLVAIITMGGIGVSALLSERRQRKRDKEFRELMKGLETAQTEVDGIRSALFPTPKSKELIN